MLSRFVQVRIESNDDCVRRTGRSQMGTCQPSLLRIHEDTRGSWHDETEITLQTDRYQNHIHIQSAVQPQRTSVEEHPHTKWFKTHHAETDRERERVCVCVCLYSCVRYDGSTSTLRWSHNDQYSHNHTQKYQCLIKPTTTTKLQTTTQYKHTERDDRDDDEWSTTLEHANSRTTSTE